MTHNSSITDDRVRCAWAQSDDLIARYHDEEWGKTPGSDNQYFESLMLEVFQSGLSWRTILHRREGFRQAFARFSIPVVANYTQHEVERLMEDEKIIRHRGKIEAAIINARAFQTIQKQAGSFRDWLQHMPCDDRVIYRALKPHLKFFGPTVCISFLQSVGKVTPPHDPDCWLADQ